MFTHLFNPCLGSRLVFHSESMGSLRKELRVLEREASRLYQASAAASESYFSGEGGGVRNLETDQHSQNVFVRMSQVRQALSEQVTVLKGK